MSESINQVIKDISNKYNPSTSTEGVALLIKTIASTDSNSDPTTNHFIDTIKKGSKEFEQRTGEKMTYSQMRQMFG